LKLAEVFVRDDGASGVYLGLEDRGLARITSIRGHRRGTRLKRRVYSQGPRLFPLNLVPTRNGRLSFDSLLIDCDRDVIFPRSKDGCLGESCDSSVSTIDEHHIKQEMAGL
jgi:hypothetical protein